MPRREFIIAALIALLLACAGRGLAEDDAPAGDQPPADQPAASIPSPEGQTDRRAHITFGEYSLRASSLTYAPEQVTAEGSVEVTSPAGAFTADAARYDLRDGSGYLEGVAGLLAPFHFHAASMSVDSQQVKRIQRAALTTCADAQPHYQLTAGDLTAQVSGKFEARRISLEIGGRRLFTIPRISGQLSPGRSEIALPAITAGSSRIDGAYLGGKYSMALGGDVQLSIQARAGARGAVRGGLYVTRPFSVGNGLAAGEISLMATRREDVENRLLATGGTADERLRDLTISRLPGLQVALDPITLTGRAEGWGLRLGGGYGRYEEDPTGVKEDRAQLWGVLRSPTIPLGPWRLHGEYGMRQTLYSGDSHTDSVTQVTVESLPDAERYVNVSLLHRSESGRTPFLFDRVLISDELFTEFEVPVTRDGRWRLGAWSRFDIDRRTSRDFSVTAIYRLDCLSYGLTYNRAARSIGLGLVINAFGSFHRGVSSIEFTQ